MDPDVNGKGPFELQAQLAVSAVIYLIRERQLCDVGLGEKSDLLKHAGQRTSCVCTARETKKTDFVI
jgi:hypothetical protein